MSAPIVVVGDSHSSFFGGADAVVAPYPAEPAVHGRFRVFHVGPGLAASLVERQSENNTRAKALDVLSRFDPASTAAVLLCFGEIDCRFHILRRAGLDAPADPARVKLSIGTTVHRYMSFILEVRAMGFRPVVVAPVATSTADWPPPYEWPTLGTGPERNTLTATFTQQLAEICDAWGIPCISILPALVDAGLATRPELYFDGVHLGQAAWPEFARSAAAAVPGLELE